jgi:hypothetical protein
MLESKLVDATGLLEALFPETSRPSVRWVRSLQRKRLIPFIRLGRLVRFDVAEVRRVIAEQHTIKRK